MQNREILDLKASVNNLQLEFSTIKQQIIALSNSESGLSKLTVSSHTTIQKPAASSASASPRAASYSEVVSGVKQIPGLTLERKFNVVLYGIQESTRGTLKHQRQQHDLEEASSLISSTSNLVSPGAIRDCFRLGKYTPQLKRPRPLLVMSC